MALRCAWRHACAQCALTDLDLNHAMNDTGAARLARALHLNRSLTKLGLANSHVAASGGIALAEALRVNVTLTHVTLAGNLLNDTSIVTLAASLAGNKVRFEPSTHTHGTTA